MLEINQELRNEINKTSRTFEAYLQDIAGNNFVISKGEFNFPYSSNNLTMGAVSSASISCDVLSNAIRKNQVLKLFVKVKGVESQDIQLGQFKVTEVKKIDGEYQPKQRIIAYDKINFITKKVYSSVGEKTIAELWSDICLKSISSGFTRAYVEYTGEFAEQEIDSSLFSGYNIRDVMSYLSAYIGCNVVVNNIGLYELRPFSKQNYENLNYNRIGAPSIDEEDTLINYIVAKKSNEETLTSGDTTGQGFVLTNPIANQTMLDSVLLSIKRVLPSYRVGQINYMLADPSVEVGDILPLYRLSTNEEPLAYIPVMEIKYIYDGGLSCTIYSNKPNENQALTLSEKIDFSVKDTVDSRKYAQAAIDFSKSMSEGLGMYTTESVDSTGAKIFYMHNQPSIERSTMIWKSSSAGIGFATSWQGDDTIFVTGVNTEGNIITNMLTVYKVNADMIEADAVTAEKIKVEDLSSLNATIANWTIHSNLLYVPSAKQNDGTYRYGIGLSNTTVAFYAGYLSDDEVYGTGKEEYKGSPWDNPSKTFDETKVNFYVTREGKLVAKNAEINGKIVSTTSDRKSKVVVDKGGFECYTTPPNGYISKYGEIKAIVDKNISLTLPAMCIRSDINNSVGLLIGASDSSWYAMYNNEQTGNITDYAYRHSIYGNVWFKSSILGNGYYLMYNNDNAAIDVLRFQSSNNLQIGSNKQPKDTVIYAGNNRYIYAMNDFVIASGKGIFLNVNDSLNRAFYYGTVSDKTGLYIGLPYEDMYLIATDTYIQSLRNTYIRASGSIYAQSDLILETGKSISFVFNNSPKIALYYGTPSGTDYNGFHIGIGDEPLYLWGSSVNALASLDVQGEVTVNGKLNITSGIFTNGVRNFGVASNGTLIFGDNTNQVGPTNIYAKTNIGLIANFINCNADLKIYGGKSINFNVNGTFNRAIYYGAVVSSYGTLTGLHFGIQTTPLYFWGTGIFRDGSVAVTSDKKLKFDIEELTNKHEIFFEALKPKTFKYVEGTSGRNHLGFIAQEVYEAITEADLTTQDIASYVSLDVEGEDEILALRYEEFIALNTYMIQKCLSKISFLEDEIKLLKETIKNG